MTLDELISEFDRGLRSMTGVSRMSRPIPEAPPIQADSAEATNFQIEGRPSSVIDWKLTGHVRIESSSVSRSGSKCHRPGHFCPGYHRMDRLDRRESSIHGQGRQPERPALVRWIGRRQRTLDRYTGEPFFRPGGGW